MWMLVGLLNLDKYFWYNLNPVWTEMKWQYATKEESTGELTVISPDMG